MVPDLLTTKQKEMKTKKLWQHLMKTANEFSLLNNHFVAVLCPAAGGTPLATGSQSGINFLNTVEAKEFQINFSNVVSGSKPLTKAKSERYCPQVTAILNKKYENARLGLPGILPTKFRPNHIPYKQSVPHIIFCRGLPDNEKLQYPSSMSTSLQQFIVNNQEDIDVVIDYKKLDTEGSHTEQQSSSQILHVLDSAENCPNVVDVTDCNMLTSRSATESASSAPSTSTGVLRRINFNNLPARDRIEFLNKVKFHYRKDAA